MLNVNLSTIEGLEFFTALDSNTRITCIGVGQAPDTGVNYVVGSTWDQANNRFSIRTYLFKDVTFIGKPKLP